MEEGTGCRCRGGKRVSLGSRFSLSTKQKMMNDETDKQQLRAPTALTRGRLNHSKTRHFSSLREKEKRVFIYLFSGDICAVVLVA